MTHCEELMQGSFPFRASHKGDAEEMQGVPISPRPDFSQQHPGFYLLPGEHGQSVSHLAAVLPVCLPDTQEPHRPIGSDLRSIASSLV